MIFPARFHPASALSAPSGHLPLEGKALFVVILFPHMRVFVLMLWGKRYSRIVAFPIEKGGPRQRRSGTFVYRLLETISPALFHPAFPIQPPPLRGTSFHRKEGEPHPRTKAFPTWEGSDARIPLSPTVISSESEKSFSFAVKKKRESIGKRETRYSICFEITSFHSGIKNPLKQFGYLPCLL